MPLSRANLGNKSEKDLAGLKRSKSAVRLDEDEETVVVDVTRLHRKEVRHLAATTSPHATHLAMRCDALSAHLLMPVAVCNATVAICRPANPCSRVVLGKSTHAPLPLFCSLLQVDPALRRALLDEALETQEQDNEELLRKVRQRLDR